MTKDCYKLHPHLKPAEDKSGGGKSASNWTKVKGSGGGKADTGPNKAKAAEAAKAEAAKVADKKKKKKKMNKSATSDHVGGTTLDSEMNLLQAGFNAALDQANIVDAVAKGTNINVPGAGKITNTPTSGAGAATDVGATKSK